MKNIIICLSILLALYSCDDPYENTTYQVYEVNPVSTYLDSRPDDFSEWVQILKYADLYNAVNQADQSFTVFAPDNAAVKAFYKKKGVNSISDLGKEYARNLSKYHIIGDTIDYNIFTEGGKLDKRTLSDDYLSVIFDQSVGEGGLKSIFINSVREARVTELSIRVSNGFVYVLNGVLSPLVETVYERIDETGQFTIFKEALTLTTWKDSLNIIYDDIKQPNGATIKQKRDYTLLSVSDETFKKAGISSIDDLILKLKAGDDYQNVENGLFRYVAYHIMKGNNSLFDLRTFQGNTTKKMLETMTDAVMEFSLEADKEYYINYDGGDGKKAMFIDNISDIQAKNGIIHELDNYVPIWQSEIPQTVYFDFCNYPEIATYIKDYGKDGQIYQAEQAAEKRTPINDISCYNVEYTGYGAPLATYDYVNYFTVKTGSPWSKCLNKDQLILNIGYLGSISMKTPTIIAGKYKVTLYFGYATSMAFMRTMTEGSNGGRMEFSFDGTNKQELAPYPSVLATTLDVYNTVFYEELEFTKTGSHTFKIIVKDPTASSHSKFRIQLDYLLFEPII